MTAHNVLIIEDDMWLGQQFERTIKRANYEVRVTSNAPLAMEMIDDQQPSVIVLDILLSGTTGLTLLHELQTYHDTADIPVIVCTNLASSLKLADLQPYGVKRILDKTSMHPDDLVTAIRSVTA
jgi:DNA-binding response OmpR family regulator